MKLFNYIIIILILMGILSSGCVEPEKEYVYIYVTPIPTTSIPEPDCVIESTATTVDIVCSNGYSYHRHDDVYREDGIRPASLIIPTIKPISTIIYTPVPTPNSPKYNSDDVWEFIDYVQSNWVYEYDVDDEIVQTPQVSYDILTGDCDDFATMIAYYIEEVYGYDTELVEIYMSDTGNYHLVAFVKVTDSYTDEMANSCNVNAFPYYTKKDGSIYAPIDWEVCPGWSWASEESITTHEWEYYMGKAV